MFDNLWQTFAHLKVACENTQAGGEEGWLFSQANLKFFFPVGKSEVSSRGGESGGNQA